MSFTGNIIINCKRATYLQEKRKEGKITMPEGFGLWLHLLYCKFCRLFLKQMKEMDKYSKRFSEIAGQRFALTAVRKAELQKAFEEESRR